MLFEQADTDKKMSPPRLLSQQVLCGVGRAMGSFLDELCGSDEPEHTNVTNEQGAKTLRKSLLGLGSSKRKKKIEDDDVDALLDGMVSPFMLCMLIQTDKCLISVNDVIRDENVLSCIPQTFDDDCCGISQDPVVNLTPNVGKGDE